MRPRVLIIILLFFISASLCWAAADDVFTAAGIQFEISEEVYLSEDTFFTFVDREILTALDSEYRPDLIIFPEYIGVFYQLIEFNDIIGRYSTFQAALTHILAEKPHFKSMAELFLKPAAWESYLTGWADLADRYNVTLIAGSCFVDDGAGGLRNRTHVFGPDGKLEYYQDKVYLTDFENDIIGLTPGRLDAAGFFYVDGRDIALTICRDAYSTDWEQKNDGAFLWIDIKANGEVYNQQQQRSFMRALPSRMINSNVTFGMTVCAVGSYLDLFWEGESSALYKSAEGLALIDLSDSSDGPDRIYLNISGRQ